MKNIFDSNIILDVFIVYRDIKEFKHAQIQIYTPEELYHRLSSK